MQEFICKSKNGVEVFYDPIHSHAATHFNDTSNLRELVTEIITALDLMGNEIADHFNMGRIIGKCDLVSVDSTDEIVYAIRKNRKDDGLVPFVKNRVGRDSHNVAVHLVPQTNGTYILSSAWIGKFDSDDEPFPQSQNATENSKSYWNTHAFVWGSQEIIPRTKTKHLPW